MLYLSKILKNAASKAENQFKLFFFQFECDKLFVKIGNTGKDKVEVGDFFSVGNSIYDLLNVL